MGDEKSQKPSVSRSISKQHARPHVAVSASPLHVSLAVIAVVSCSGSQPLAAAANTRPLASKEVRPQTELASTTGVGLLCRAGYGLSVPTKRSRDSPFSRRSTSRGVELLPLLARLYTETVSVSVSDVKTNIWFGDTEVLVVYSNPATLAKGLLLIWSKLSSGAEALADVGLGNRVLPGAAKSATANGTKSAAAVMAVANALISWKPSCSLTRISGMAPCAGQQKSDGCGCAVSSRHTQRETLKAVGHVTSLGSKKPGG